MSINDKNKKKKPDSKIVNMYEKIPKHLLVKAENPNYDLHKLKLPFRAVVNAPSGSGKTNFVINLIGLFSYGKGTFADITILTRNSDEPLYNFLKEKDDRIVIKEGLVHLPPLDKFDKDENHLVIFDDLVLTKDQSRIEQYYIRARKLNVSVMYLSQSYFRIPKVIRLNCNYMIILKLSGSKRDLNAILGEFGMGLEREELLALYDYATAEKFSPLVIDADADPADRFRKGLTEIIAIDK